MPSARECLRDIGIYPGIDTDTMKRLEYEKITTESRLLCLSEEQAKHIGLRIGEYNEIAKYAKNRAKAHDQSRRGTNVNYVTPSKEPAGETSLMARTTSGSSSMSRSSSMSSTGTLGYSGQQPAEGSGSPDQEDMEYKNHLEKQLAVAITAHNRKHGCTESAFLVGPSALGVFRIRCGVCHSHYTWNVDDGPYYYLKKQL